ncbi:uncharacterized protein LOC6584912 [Drosophila mojavensis]|uniref:Protein TsetseEP domain-containing protein n=2 Tax=mojavensis species complex TaxID=198037 RepID=B4L2Y3_DROMO|nr:uncharacterized protein LOC6584912 [Drosophila mojavensis]XP_017872298.1 PREDICTED: uncharacterized protein LOC108619966 [Drosophila arizonae]EDW07869.1 uncharacterized protein Dmoj_GI15989 [Drosophila mojavensis]
MRQLFVIGVLTVLLLGLSHSQADLLDCEEKVPAVLSEIGDKFSEMTGSSSSSEHEVRDFFKSVGCQIKKGAKKLGERAKDLGSDIKEGAKKLGERAKDLGSDISDRIADFRDKLSKDSAEDMSKDRGFLANVEIINPDLLKGEQQCGHGHILDALGNCSKLRK